MFSQCRQKSKTLIKREYYKYLQIVVQGIISDSTQFWKYLKKKQSENTTCLISGDGQIIDNSLNISQSFATYFSTTFITDNSNTRTSNKLNYVIPMADIFIDETDVEWSIKKLKSKKSMGPDQILAYL